MKNRCINLDWLEVYCIESQQNYPHNADFFRSQGFFVRERNYGTRVYRQMFTILDDHDEPFIEIRREPVGAFRSGERCVIDPFSCHIRLSNRACYRQDAARVIIDFLARFGFEFRRISRVDICLDFERFDSGDDPQRFINRYLRHKYAKINQSNLSAHGKEMWDGLQFNSLSWGSPSSSVSTKLYDKTMELRQVHDKPYIRQAWFLSELIDNPYTLVKVNRDGKSYEAKIWRLEFSVRSSLPGWIAVKTCHGENNKYQSIRNTLDLYTSRESMLNIFASLAYHYFDFVYFKNGLRKYDCPHKVLWQFSSQQSVFYKVDKVATSKVLDKSIPALKKRLEQYQLTHPFPEIRKACKVLLDDLNQTIIRSQLADPFDRNEKLLLQQLIALRMSRRETMPLSDDKALLEAILTLDTAIF